jgi:hypothetical protein
VNVSSISIGEKGSPVGYAPTVDPDSHAPVGRFDTYDANKRFVVIRDDEGYGVWRLEDLGEGEPIQRFADDDGGYQLASDMWAALTREDRRRRSPWLSPLKWVVILSAILWASASILSSTIFYLNEFDAFRDGFQDFSALYQVLEVVSTIGYSLLLGATGIYVVLWLEARRDR